MKTSQTDQTIRREQYEEMARLRWNLVELSRQNWTLISISVVAACAWLLTRGHPATQGTPLGWVAGAVSLLFSVGFVIGQHALARTQHRLTRLEAETGCRATYPLLKVLRSLQ